MRLVIGCAGVFGFLFVGGCGTTANCAVCGQAFSDAECQQFADQSGCESGVAVEDPICGDGTMGCDFTGCGTGPVECASTDTDTL